MKHLPAVIVLVALLLFLMQATLPEEPYLYDEADYMYAAALGFFANYSDTPTLSIAAFFRIGLDRGKDPAQRQGLSELIRRTNDIIFYRHWHGPFYHYFLIPVSRLGLNEFWTRASMLAIPVCSLLGLYFGCLWLVPGRRGIMMALLACALFLSSYSVDRSSELAPHQLFALCLLCSLILLAKAATTGRRPFWYLAVVAAALAFCTLEIAFVLVLTLAICGYLERKRLHMTWPLAARSLLVFVATVLVVWPAAIFKLSFLKAYVFMAYLALFRKAPWGEVGFLETWQSRLLNSPMEWTLVLLSVVLFCRYRALADRRVAYPMLILILLMIAATLHVSTNTARYSLLFMPALDLFAAFTLSGVLASWRRQAGNVAVALLSIGLFATACYELPARPSNPNPRPSAVLSFVRVNKLDDKALLVPQADLPMIHYYFPKTRLRGYYDVRPSPPDLVSFAADAILYPGYPIRFERSHAF